MKRSSKYYQMFRSGLEGVVSDFLKIREKKYEYKCTYESEKLPYIIEGKYLPDFVLEFADGSKVYIETKGYLDNDARRKMVAVKKANPDKDIRILFAKDNPLRKNAKSKYSDWAIKTGFPFAVKDVPLDWLTKEGI